MSTSSYDSVFSLGATRITVGLETSIYMQAQPGQVSTLLKMFSGGTLEILAPGMTALGIGVNLATTLTAAGLSAVSGLGYAFSAAEVVSISGPASYYLNARGATCILHALFGKGQGF